MYRLSSETGDKLDNRINSAIVGYLESLASRHLVSYYNIVCTIQSKLLLAVLINTVI